MRKHCFTCLYIVVALLGWAVTASAAWTDMKPAVITSGWACTHGHAGHIQGSLSGSFSYMGWGLDVTLNPPSSNWVHYSLPVPAGHKTRHINISFHSYSNDVLINQVDIWDGGVSVDSIPVTGWTGNDVTIDQGVTLSADHVVTDALGVSILLGSGVENLSHRIILYTVCADMFP